MSNQNGSNGHDHHKFPVLEVAILVICVSVNAYTLVNLFPYVGVMVMQLMELKSINEAGEAPGPYGVWLGDNMGAVIKYTKSSTV